jgi:hypothetical protein
MTTRRTATARAASQALSDVSSAPAATPRRSSSRLKDKTPSVTALPVVGPRISNAYGTAGVNASGQATGPVIANQVGAILTAELGNGNVDASMFVHFYKIRLSIVQRLTFNSSFKKETWRFSCFISSWQSCCESRC